MALNVTSWLYTFQLYVVSFVALVSPKNFASSIYKMPLLQIDESLLNDQMKDVVVLVVVVAIQDFSPLLSCSQISRAFVCLIRDALDLCTWLLNLVDNSGSWTSRFFLLFLSLSA